MARNRKLWASLWAVANMWDLKYADVRWTVNLARHEMNKARWNMRTANAEYFPIAKKQYKKAKGNYYSLGKKYWF